MGKTFFSGAFVSLTYLNGSVPVDVLTDFKEIFTPAAKT